MTLDSLAVWRRAAAALRAAIGPLVLYDLLFKALGFLVLTPLAAFALERLLAAGGTLSVTNTDIVGFLVSPWGLAFLATAGTLTLVSLFAEQAGLMQITAEAYSGRRPDWFGALRLALAALPRLAITAAAQTLILLAVLLPLAGLGAAAFFGLLGTHDINWYLSERPPQFWLATGAGALLLLAALAAVSLLLVRWALAVPVCLYEGLAGRPALRRSQELGRGHRRPTAVLVLGWVGAVAAAAVLVLTALDSAAGWLLGLITGVTPRIALTALLLGTATLTGVLVSFIGFAGYAFIVVHLYSELAHEPLSQPEAGRKRISGRLGKPAVALIMAAVAIVSVVVTGGLTDDLIHGRDVQVTAHRGASAKAPENSLSAIRQAISEGADVAEIDVQETADGTLVLLHDTDLMRIAGLDRKIWEVTYDEIRELDAGSWFSPEYAGEPIATLAQAIDVARGRIRLNIELKYNGHDRRLAESTAELVRETGFTDQCVITSLDQAGLGRVREIAPEFRIGQIVTAALGDAKRLDVDLLSMQAALATPGQVRANRVAGLETHVWTLNDRESMERMIERGVDNIITDEPALLRRVIDERAALSDRELLLLALSARLKE